MNLPGAGSEYDDPRTRLVISCFEAGTNVLLAKSTSREVFLRTLELVLLGETLLPQELLAYLRPDTAQQAESSDQIDDLAADGEEDETDGTPPLSGRERTILLCLVEGESNKVIARRIGIAESTVKVHVKTILRKIRAHNRTQAAIWAMNNKICPARPEIALLAKATLVPGAGDQDGRSGDDCTPDGSVEPLIVPDNAVTKAANGGTH